MTLSATKLPTNHNVRTAMRVTLESRKKGIDPSVTHWDDRKRCWDDRRRMHWDDKEGTLR